MMSAMTGIIQVQMLVFFLRQDPCKMDFGIPKIILGIRGVNFHRNS